MDALGNYFPPLGFYFKVIISGVSGEQEGSFMEVSGISVSITPDDKQEGGENRFPHRFPNPPKYKNLSLKRGMVVGSGLISWAQTSLTSFTFTPKTVEVLLLNDQGQPISVWVFSNAYPVKLEMSGLKSMKEGEIMVETLELAYSFFEQKM
ncbi:phage tail protein [Chitinophaga oryziterrae]|uniref:Phage tail protein n=1 Tax=Chitinophaga oryziterrae TaxID=1031224 RepID=A0A6N8JGZ8_9BACT|nr:phage tail protein [Chitinophaga oryziterrae]MVT44523.1 phage tail protein [Chitinophaga oryziterrae]